MVRKHNGGVYILRCDNLYKIGLSKNVLSRFDSLYTDLQKPIHLLNVIRTNDMYLAEKHLHEKYTRYWVMGEWFCLPEDIVLEIMSITSIVCNWKDKTYHINSRQIDP